MRYLDPTGLSTEPGTGQQGPIPAPAPTPAPPWWVTFEPPLPPPPTQLPIPQRAPVDCRQSCFELPEEPPLEPDGPDGPIFQQYYYNRSTGNWEGRNLLMREEFLGNMETD